MKCTASWFSISPEKCMLTWFYECQNVTFGNEITGSITRLAAEFQIATCKVGAAV
jgi:hypothetical protein